MNINSRILKNFDIDNDGILNSKEKSAYDVHVEQADLTKLKDSVANLKDKISGGKGNDKISGGKGNDKISGGKGNDKINGGKGNDKINGGKGNDKINGGKGNDKISGGKGNDTAIFEMSSDSFLMDYDDAGNIIITDALDDNNVTTVSGVENFIFLSEDGEEVLTREELVEFIDDMRATTKGIAHYRQDDGLVLGGVLENGLEFERFGIIDNKNYYQVNSDGTTSHVIKGQVVSQGENLGISDVAMRFQNLQSLEDMDTSLVDPDGSKFSRMNEAFNISSIGSVDYYDSGIDDWVGTDPVKKSLQNNIVDKFLLAFGNDEKFMQAIEENGFNITIADKIIGNNPYGDQWSIAGFYSPKQDEQGRNTIVISEKWLNSQVFVHELAHARDHLVDGSIDGVLGDIDSKTFDNAIAKSRQRANNGAAQGLFDIDYANTNEVEFLAEMFNGYYSNPVLFEQKFPEFTAALGETFGHLDQTIGLLNFNETSIDRMFDDYQNIPADRRILV
jgi:hypothetical protein